MSGAGKNASRGKTSMAFIVTSIDVGSAEWIYDCSYCAHGQAKNLIKLQKAQLASNCTSCRSALADPARIALHTTAYWLRRTFRDAGCKGRTITQANYQSQVSRQKRRCPREYTD